MTLNGSPPVFPLFPTLPIELQIKIWEYTLPGPRILQASQFEYADGKEYIFQSASHPSAIYTCKTSREVALSHMKRAFIHDEKKGSRLATYVNFAHDTIYLATSSFPTNAYFEFAASFPDIKQIRSLAVTISSCDDDKMIIDMERALMDIMTPSICGHSINLREIVFVVRHPQCLPAEFAKLKFAEYVRFFEPEPYKWATSQLWGRSGLRWFCDVEHCLGARTRLQLGQCMVWLNTGSDQTYCRSRRFGSSC